MVNATSISENQETWTQSLAEIGRRYGVVVHLVEVIGRRWSYLAGPTDEHVPMLAAGRLTLREPFAAIVYADQPVPKATLDSLEQDLQALIEVR